jgi:hypothetical protein
MPYDERTFDAIADLLVSLEQPTQQSILRGFDDYVIALSLDSGLPLDDARVRLKERMSVVQKGLRSARLAQKYKHFL